MVRMARAPFGHFDSFLPLPLLIALSVVLCLAAFHAGTLSTGGTTVGIRACTTRPESQGGVVGVVFGSVDSWSSEEAAALYKFTVRALADVLPEPPPKPDDDGKDGDGPQTYLYGHVHSDQNLPNVIRGLAQSYSDLVSLGHRDVRILVYRMLNDGSPEDRLSGYIPNFDRQKDTAELVLEESNRIGEGGIGIYDHPIRPDRIEAYPWPAYEAHTLVEAIAIVDHCRRRGAAALVLTAPSFHMPRALLTVLSVASKSHPLLDVHAAPGPRNLRWDETVAHSQGTLVARRDALLEAEHERLLAYHRKGDLMAPSAALEMLRERDGRAGRR